MPETLLAIKSLNLIIQILSLLKEFYTIKIAIPAANKHYSVKYIFFSFTLNLGTTWIIQSFLYKVIQSHDSHFVE